MPSGRYDKWEKGETKKLQDWVKSGGKLIAIDGALDFFADKEGYSLSQYLNEEEKKAYKEIEENAAARERTAAFQDRERLDISNSSVGAVFEVQIDSTYALGFGTEGKFYALKNNAKRYAYLKKGVNAGIIPSMDHHRTGFIGYKAQSQIAESLVFGVENQGKGQIIYMVDNPIFRGFWESGKLILANAIFLVQ